MRKLLPLAVLCFILTSVYFTKELWLVKISDFLIFKDKIGKADLIVCLGGGRKDRVYHAVELYKKHTGKKLLFTGDTARGVCIDTTWAELGRLMAIKLGCFAEDIYVLKRPSSTYEEALFIRKFLEKNKFTSAIIISDPYHMRRIKLTFNKVFEGSLLKLFFDYPESSWYLSDSWWVDEDSLVALVNEYLKLVLYKAKGYI